MSMQVAPPTQILGAIQTSRVQMSISAGKAMRVAVKPKRLITMPVPNRENRKEIELVVCGSKNTNIINSHYTKTHMKQEKDYKKDMFFLFY